ncbi:MAG: hypothetical protein ACK5RI_00350, partial [Bacteroidota bacterium]
AGFKAGAAVLAGCDCGVIGAALLVEGSMTGMAGVCAEVELPDGSISDFSPSLPQLIKMKERQAPISTEIFRVDILINFLESTILRIEVRTSPNKKASTFVLASYLSGRQDCLRLSLWGS